jgi:hypothetical protein
VPESDSDIWRGWQTGYRAWKVGFKGDEPRLGSVAHEGFWEPGEEFEVKSNLEPGEDIEHSTKGMYSLGSLKEVKEHRYNEPGTVVGAIIPHGRTVHGERGFRSEKATVKSLFRTATPCYICEKQAKYFIKENGGGFSLCKSCYGKLKRLIEKKGYKEWELEALLGRLAQIYGAEVVEPPEF